MYTITKTYEFSAAHYLPYVAADHPCSRMHGHNYVVIVEVEGGLDSKGMVLDYNDLDAAMEPFIDEHLDHRTLNDVVENPTAEHMAYMLFGVARARVDRLLSGDAQVVSVTVCETLNSTATYVPERKDE